MTETETIDSRRRHEAGDWLLRLQADELDQDELSAWLDWYGASPENGAAFEELQRQYESLRGAPLAMRRALAQTLTGGRENARSSHAARPAPLISRSTRWSLAAAVAVVAAGAAAFWWTRPALVVDRPVHTAAYQTPRAQHEEVRLPDGSTVKLGAHSSISLSFTDDTRYLALEGGEAFFTVARDARRPFVVQVGEVTVRALGTAFNIRRVQGQVVVAVSEGVVELGRKKRTPERQPLRLAAGEQASVNFALAAVDVAPVAPQAVAAWQNGRLEFVNEPLSTVIETVNRYSSREIVLVDRNLGEQSYTGTVNENRIEEWLSALPAVFPLEVKVVGADTVLLATKK